MKNTLKIIIEESKRDPGTAFSKSAQKLLEKLKKENITAENYSEIDFTKASTLFSTIQSFMEEERDNPVSEAFAAYALGRCYSLGEGVKQDKSQAVEWYRKAADQGLVAAQNNLGICYMNGEGVHEDMREAVRWYEKAAKQGFAAAHCNLGVCYKQGWGVDKDMSQALQWYTKAAKQGNAKAQHNLGNCYYHGWSVTQNGVLGVEWYRKAVHWYRKAAKQGYAAAQSKLQGLFITRIHEKLRVITDENGEEVALWDYLLDPKAQEYYNYRALRVATVFKQTIVEVLPKLGKGSAGNASLADLRLRSIVDGFHFITSESVTDEYCGGDKIVEKKTGVFSICNEDILIANNSALKAKHCLELIADSLFSTEVTEVFSQRGQDGFLEVLEEYKSNEEKKVSILYLLRLDITAGQLAAGGGAEEMQNCLLWRSPGVLSSASFCYAINKATLIFLVRCIPYVLYGIPGKLPRLCDDGLKQLKGQLADLIRKSDKDLFRFAYCFGGDLPDQIFYKRDQNLLRVKLLAIESIAIEEIKYHKNSHFGGRVSRSNFFRNKKYIWLPLLEEYLEEQEAVPSCNAITEYIKFSRIGGSEELEDYKLSEAFDLARGGSFNRRRGVKRDASQMSSSSAAEVCDLSGAGVCEELVAHVIPQYSKGSVVELIAEEPLENSDNTKLASEDDLYQSAQNMRKKIIFYLKQSDLSFCCDNVARIMEQNRCGLNLKREPKAEEDVLQQLFGMLAKGGEHQSVFFEVMSLLVEFFSSEDEFSIDEIKSFKEFLIGYQGNCNVNALIITVGVCLSDLGVPAEAKQGQQPADTPVPASGCGASSDDKTMGVSKDKRDELEGEPGCKQPCEIDHSQQGAENKAKADNSSPAPSVAPDCSGASSSSGVVGSVEQSSSVESSQSGTDLVDIKSFFTEDSSSLGEQSAQGSEAESRDASDASISSSSTESESDQSEDQSEDLLPNEVGFPAVADRLAKVLKPDEEDLTVDDCYAEYFGGGELANNPRAGNCYVNYLKYASDDAQWSEGVSRMNLEYYRAQAKSSVLGDIEVCLDIVERLKFFLRDIKNKVRFGSDKLGYHLRIRVNKETQDEFGVSVAVFDYCVRVISFYHKLPVLIPALLDSLQKEGLCDFKKNQSRLISSILPFSRDEGEGLGLLASRVMMKSDVCFNIDDLNGLIGNEGGAVSFWYYLLAIHPDYLVTVGERHDGVAGLLRKLERLGFNKGNMADASLKTRKARMYGTYYHRAPGHDNIIRVIPNQFSGAWNIKYDVEEGRGGQGITVQSINHSQSLRKGSSKVSVFYSPQEEKEQDHLGRLLCGNLMDFMFRKEYKSFDAWGEDDRKAVRELYSSDMLMEKKKLPLIVGMRKGFWAPQQYRRSTYEFWASIMFARSLKENLPFPLNGDAVSCSNLLKKTFVTPSDYEGFMLGALSLYLNGMDSNAGKLWLCVSGISSLGPKSIMTITCGSFEKPVKVQICFSTIFLSVKETGDEAEQENEQQRLAVLLHTAVVNGLGGDFSDR